ncbi:MAG TPA: ABC transporter permease [candidate division Zixibacteria bacterium]|nr:ABC transporter permease [candidate division Zixibacteria bacterium]
MSNKNRLVQMIESARMALGAIAAHKFRSSMTIIGVLIGVAAVILVNTILEGFKVYTETSIDKIGTNVIYVTRWASHQQREDARESGRTPPEFTMREVDAILDGCDLIQAVAPQKRYFNNVAKYGNKRATNPDDFRGVWPEQAIVTNRSVEFGRFIDQSDLFRRSMVCVLGPEMADALFETREDAVGKIITVNSHKFTVIGVQEEIDDLFGISENDFIFIPLTTFEKLYPSVTEVTILCSAVSKERFDEALDEVTSALRRVRHVRPDEENNFGLMTQDRFKDEIGSITTNIRLGGLAISSVALMVGLIGVMNIMLISVTERTREIGVRKAIGAKRSNIVLQFLTEAATLTTIGGVAGIAIGAGVGFIFTSLAEWTYYLSGFWITVGLILSAGTGLLAGTYPAWKAARLDPIEALRYE